MSINKSTPSKQVISTTLLWILPLFWSANYIIAKLANGVIPPNLLAIGRWIFAALLMTPFVWGDKKIIIKSIKTEWHQLIILGMLGVWICGSFVYIGAKTTSANNIALIYSSAPVGITLASTWILREKLHYKQITGLALALSGVIFIIAQGNIQSLTSLKWVAGDFWIATATASWVAYTLLQKHWTSQLSAMQRLFCIALLGVAVLAPFAINELLEKGVSWMSWKAGILIMGAGLIPGLLSYLTYTFLLEELGASKASLVLYLSPVYSAFVAWLVLGETPQWFHLVGAILVLPSIYLATSATTPRTE